MTATATAAKRSEALTPAVIAKATATPQKKQAVMAQADAFAAIQDNTFAKIIFDPNLTLEAKRDAIAQALTYSGTKEQMRERVREFEAIKEYLQNKRSEMSEEIIRLTDTETFSDLKRIYDDLNGALLDFDKRMAPLSEILDAVYTLRTEGAAIDTFKEIQADREREKALAQKRQGIQDDADIVARELADLNRQIVAESQKKSLFGLGGVKAEAQARIAELKTQVESRTAHLAGLRNDLAAVNQETEDARSKVGKYAAEKAKLRELLDISSDEHKQRQQDLVDAAIKFVSVAKERTGAVRERLTKMNGQVENLADANGSMTQIYAIFNDGLKKANVDNQTARAALNAPAGEESLIEKMTREEKASDLDNHIKLVEASTVDTMTTYTDLTSQTIRIKSMRDANNDQIDKARMMNAQGVAGVADRLSVALSAVNQAAISESSALARETLITMADNTNRVAQKEVIRAAMGISDRNTDMSRAIEGLAAYGEVLNTGTEIARGGIKEMRAKLAEMEETAKSVHAAIRENSSVYSEQDEAGEAPSGGATSSNPTSTKPNGLVDPFAKKS